MFPEFKGPRGRAGRASCIERIPDHRGSRFGELTRSSLNQRLRKDGKLQDLCTRISYCSTTRKTMQGLLSSTEITRNCKIYTQPRISMHREPWVEPVYISAYADPWFGCLIGVSTHWTNSQVLRSHRYSQDLRTRILVLVRSTINIYSMTDPCMVYVC